MKRNTPSAGDASPHAAPQPGHATPLDRSHRRRLLQAITAVGATSAALPDRWSRPVIDSVLLPAHAQVTPVEVCELTCSRAQQETWVVVRNAVTAGAFILGYTSATIVQCESANGMVSVSSTTFQTSVGVLPGTLSTATTLASLTGTDPGNTFISFENSSLFQSVC